MGKRKERDSHEDSIITENLETDSSYTVECRNGLRSIQPYFFTFTVHAKRRWLGRRLVDVFQTEYRDRSAAYYAHAIEIGRFVVPSNEPDHYHHHCCCCCIRIRVNGQQVSKTYIVCDNDTITHRVHRHEPCVTAQPPVVLYQDEQMVVIDKPASIPVHPTGRFRYNTIVSIMKRDYQLDVRRTFTTFVFQFIFFLLFNLVLLLPFLLLDVSVASIGSINVRGPAVGADRRHSYFITNRKLETQRIHCTCKRHRTKLHFHLITPI